MDKPNYRINWDIAEKSYLLDNIPYRELARQLGVSRQTVEVQGRKRQWAIKKRELNSSTSDKTTQLIQIKQSEVIEKVGNKIEQIKLKQLQQSEDLIEVGMERMTSGKPVSDAVALASIKHGQETIRELEGMRKTDHTTNILVIDSTEARERLRVMQEELRDLPLKEEEVKIKIEYPNE